MPACVLALMLSTLAQRKLVPTFNATVAISVDATANRHAIDPRIYGVAFADGPAIADLNLPLNRWGGNTTSRYNWIYSTANHARDYFFENIPDDVLPGHDGSNGESADDFIDLGSQAIMTIPVMKYLPKARQKDCAFTSARYPTCCSKFADTQFEPPDCGNGFNKDGSGHPVVGNDPLDVETLYDPASPHQAAWIQHMIAAHGSAAAPTGVKYYAIDNEPDLWDSTHFDIHPDPSTYDEIRDALYEFGPMIKTQDPNSKTLAPEISGWAWYFDSALGWAPGHDHDDFHNHGDVPLVPWLLQQAKSYEQANGTRILDILSLHWYPQGDRVNEEFNPNDPAEEVTTATKLLRNRSTRSLWDPNYTDPSWISDLGYEDNKPHLIPLMREWVNTYYPGTQIAITEYNWGAENDPNGATAQAEIFGIFGREGLDMATRWTTPPSNSDVYKAFQMFRNYGFGDLSVTASEADTDIDNLSSFAALRSSDGALTIMVIAKALTGVTPVNISLANYLPSGAPAQWWQLNANAITQQADIMFAGSTLSFNANPETVNLLIIPGAYLSAPASVNASATGNSVTVSWPPAANANSYEVYRATSINGPYTDIGPHPSGFSDSSLAFDTTYLYKVVSMHGGAVVSPASALDAATTTTFSNDPLSAGIGVQAAHITQLRTAVTAMWATAALGAPVFADTPLTTSTAIKGTHITQLRSALDQARSTLGLSAMAYTDPTITTTTTVKAAHITELRNGVK